jgi:tRNA(Ile)-lysidine synthase TilS/MesJ
MRICTQCVLNEHFPGIRFDENGVCNFCTSAKSSESRSSVSGDLEAKFRELIHEHKGRGSYDCLVAFSGGKDSTYTLHLLRERYDLRILAYSFDNWFQSETAHQNIRSVVCNLDMDHLTIRPSYENMKKIIRASTSGDMYSMKAMTRASSICTTCISLIRFAGFRIAIEQEIPFLVFGMSPGQAPLATAVVKTNPRMIRMMQEALYRPLHDKLGDVINSYFLEQRHFEKVDSFPHNINPLAFADYDEEVLFETARRYGWKKPDDTDANSTNCLLNALANQIHLETFGFNPYSFEIAELVRIGCLTREEGLERLEAPFPEDQIEEAKKKLGI